MTAVMAGPCDSPEVTSARSTAARLPHGPRPADPSAARATARRLYHRPARSSDVSSPSVASATSAITRARLISGFMHCRVAHGCKGFVRTEAELSSRRLRRLPATCQAAFTLVLQAVAPIGETATPTKGAL